MAKFLLLYEGGGMPESEAEGKAVMAAWMAWFGRLGAAVVDGGNPIGPAARSIAPDGRVSEARAGSTPTGYSILEADSLDRAVEMAKGCPHLSAGGTVVVTETFPAM